MDDDVDRVNRAISAFLVLALVAMASGIADLILNGGAHG